MTERRGAVAGNSHRHTRLVSYKRKRPVGRKLSVIWLVIPISALLAFILALILGNTLGKMADSAGSPDSVPQSSASSPTVSPHGPVTVNAANVTLKGIYDNTAASVKAQIPTDASAVSMTLFDEDKTPYYSSSVAASFGNGCGELTLKNVFRPIEENELYATVLFPSSLLSSADPNKNAVISAYEATLTAELYSAGADEIVIHFYKLGNDSEVISENFLSLMTAYVSAIRMQSKELRVGITLTPTDLKNRSNSVTVQNLHQIADFCALDLTAIESEEELTRILIDLSPDILRHEMRLILTREGRSDAFLAETQKLLDRLGMKNIQYVG